MMVKRANGGALGTRRPEKEGVEEDECCRKELERSKKRGLGHGKRREVPSRKLLKKEAVTPLWTAARPVPLHELQNKHLSGVGAFSLAINFMGPPEGLACQSHLLLGRAILCLRLPLASNPGLPSSGAAAKGRGDAPQPGQRAVHRGSPSTPVEGVWPRAASQ